MEPEQLQRSEVTMGSDNIFADLALPNPEERLLKAQLTLQIQRFIEQKDWTQAQVAAIIGLTQPQVSNLLRGRLAGFSVERLFSILVRLGHDVEVRIVEKERAAAEAQLRVQVI
ncbi:MAG: helix-turn-helix domain-containing protein [Chloroflexota bacterium]|nr:helix-turn-helix domain-containing protein [Chloroflexota bacterium]